MKEEVIIRDDTTMLMEETLSLYLKSHRVMAGLTWRRLEGVSGPALLMCFKFHTVA